MAGRDNISPAAGPGRELAGECNGRAQRPVASPKKCSSRGDKCRQPDAEVENEPDHGGLITCDYGNFREIANLGSSGFLPRPACGERPGVRGVFATAQNRGEIVPLTRLRESKFVIGFV